jgi:hypothetical protein
MRIDLDQEILRRGSEIDTLPLAERESAEKARCVVCLRWKDICCDLDGTKCESCCEHGGRAA